jgi:hypothetical protein
MVCGKGVPVVTLGLRLHRWFDPCWISPDSKADWPLGLSSCNSQFTILGVSLNELSPPQFPAAFPGIPSQIGNAVPPPVAEITTTISERTFITYEGQRTEAFGPATGIATTIAAIALVFWSANGND